MSALNWDSKIITPPTTKSRTYSDDSAPFTNQINIEGLTTANTTYLISLIRDGGYGAFPATATYVTKDTIAYFKKGTVTIANDQSAPGLIKFGIYIGTSSEETQYIYYKFLHLVTGQQVSFDIPDYEQLTIPKNTNIFLKIETGNAVTALNFNSIQTCDD